MGEATESSGQGVGFLGLLALLFIGLKLGGVITWPWPLVLMPLWGPLALVLLILIGSAAVLVVVLGLGCVFYLLPVYIFENLKKRRARKARDAGDGWTRP